MNIVRLLSLLPLVAACTARPGGTPSGQADTTVGPLALTPVPLGLPDSVGATWFAVDPANPARAVVATHTEWNTHRLVALALGETGWLPDGSVPFSGTFTDRGARFTPDGRLLFSSRRPGSGGDWDLWLVSRTAEGWSAAVPLPAPVNGTARDYHGSMTRDGVVYFISTRPGGVGEGDVYRAVPTADGYVVEHLPEGVNTSGWEVDVLVSPDESFMLLARSDPVGGYGGDDLFVAYRREGVWSEPTLLAPPVNSPSLDYGASLWPDGRTMTFTSHRGGTARVFAVPLAAVTGSPQIAP